MTLHSLAPIANHLWQSTLFAAVAALLAAMLRDNKSEIRYRLWLASSIKFLAPFSVLAELGAWMPWKSAPSVAPVFAVAAGQIGQPFVTNPDPLQIGVSTAQTGFPLLATGLVALWLCGTCFLLSRWCLQWLRLRRAIHAGVEVAISAPVKVLAVPGMMEPGVFGLFRPVLLLPRGIADHLTPSQFRAILAHELCHVRRRDNLASAAHMLVESIFWFHPLVWWLGSRLVEERERACDDEVLRLGSEPFEYAQGILTVCRLYLETPLPCTAGVTGADLRRRIESIVASRPAAKLTLARKALLAVAGGCVLSAPMLVGALEAAQAPSPGGEPNLTFEIASIRPSKAGDPNSRIGPGPGGGLRATNVTPMQLITFAYNVREFQVQEAPGWIEADRFDVLAKPERPDGPNDPKTMNDKQRMAQMEQMQLRLRGLLQDRFQLVVRKDKRDLPFYALVVGKGGSKLQAAKGGEFTPQHMQNRRGSLVGLRASLPMIINSLSAQLERTVVDQTGLKGDFDFTLDWDPTGDGGGASLFSALEEQLGLKLESKKGPVEVIVIEKISKPSEN